MDKGRSQDGAGGPGAGGAGGPGAGGAGGPGAGVLSLEDVASNLPRYFRAAYDIYGQDEKHKGNFYISDGNLFGLKMSVLPERDTVVFSTYCPANASDCQKLRQLHTDGVFKTYDCSLCAIQEPNNAIVVSDEQNQFYVDDNAASVQINQEWEGKSAIRFVLSGTTPQYHKGHLLVTASNHLPMFAVFTDTRVLKSILLFMKAGSNHIGPLYSYMNGNSGSDPWHFHVHLAVEKNPFLQQCIDECDGLDNVIKPVEKGIVRGLVFCHKDLDRIVDYVFCNMVRIMDAIKKGFMITSSFFFADEKFFVVVHVAKGSRNAQYTSLTTGQSCWFGLIVSSHQLIPLHCFEAPQTQGELDNFLNWVKTTYGDMYVSLQSLEIINDPACIYKWTENMVKITQKSGEDIIKDPDVENLYIWMEKHRVDFWHAVRSTDLATRQKGIADVHEVGLSALYWCMQKDCFVNPDTCSIEEHSKFKYMLGVAFNNVDQTIIDDPSTELIKLLINSEFARLRSLNTGGMVTTDYMYFRGSYIQHIIKRTMDDLLTVTGKGRVIPGIGPWLEKGDILRWFNHSFNKIGEDSAVGVNTVAEIKFPIPGRDCLTARYPQDCNKVDMIMKMMDTGTDDRRREFLHEFLVSMIVNDIRATIPNFSLCYGGFFCDSSDATQLCDNGVGTGRSYLLMELVKNSETLGRAIQNPQVSLDAEMNELLNGITQVIVGLSYGWQMKHFTHYDLHANNVMRYNILSTNFSSLFKGTTFLDYKEVLFRYWGDPETLGQSSAKMGGKSGSILIPATYLYLIIDYGSSHVDGMPAGTTYERGDRAAAGMTPSQGKSYVDVFTLCMSTFIMILSLKKRLLLSASSGYMKPRGVLAAFYQKFFQAYARIWTGGDWKAAMRGAIVACNNDQKLGGVLHVRNRSEIQRCSVASFPESQVQRNRCSTRF